MFTNGLSTTITQEVKNMSTLTRKHFKQFAELVKNNVDIVIHNDLGEEAAVICKLTADRLAQISRDANPLFNTRKFYDACELQRLVEKGLIRPF